MKDEENRKRRERQAKQKEKTKNKKVPESVKRAKRRKWRNDKRRQAARKREEAKLIVSKELNSTRAISISKNAKKRSDSRRVKRYIEFKKLKEKNEALQQQVKMYQQRLYRVQEKNNNLIRLKVF